MKNDTMWFANKQKSLWVPLPDPGVVRRFVHHVETGTLDQGGGYLERSRGRHAILEFDWEIREAFGADGLDVFAQFAAGLYDDYVTVIDGPNPNNLIYVTDWMHIDSNLFAPNWAAPMLGLGAGWRSIGDIASHAATAANSFGQPIRTPTFTVSHPINTLPTQQHRRFVIPIPPGYTLRWGWSGSVTGTAVMREEARTAATGAIAATSVAPLAATGATRLSRSLSGNTYDFVEIGLARTTAVASSAAVTSMRAILTPDSESPALTGLHVDGEGITGCEFLDDAIAEEYKHVNRTLGNRYKGLSFALKEVGQWR